MFKGNRENYSCMRVAASRLHSMRMSGREECDHMLVANNGLHSKRVTSRGPQPHTSSDRQATFQVARKQEEPPT